MLNWDLQEKPILTQKQLFFDLNEKEQKVYDLLHLKGQQDIDAISFASNIPVFQLSPLLLQLEMKGVLKPLPGKLFELI